MYSLYTVKNGSNVDSTRHRLQNTQTERRGCDAWTGQRTFVGTIQTTQTQVIDMGPENRGIGTSHYTPMIHRHTTAITWTSFGRFFSHILNRVCRGTAILGNGALDTLPIDPFTRIQSAGITGSLRFITSFFIRWVSDLEITMDRLHFHIRLSGGLFHESVQQTLLKHFFSEDTIGSVQSSRSAVTNVRWQLYMWFFNSVSRLRGKSFCFIPLQGLSASRVAPITSFHSHTFLIQSECRRRPRPSCWIPNTLQIIIHKMSNNNASVEDELDKMWKTQVDSVQSGPSSWRHDGC